MKRAPVGPWKYGRSQGKANGIKIDLAYAKRGLAKIEAMMQKKKGSKT